MSVCGRFALISKGLLLLALVMSQQSLAAVKRVALVIDPSRGDVFSATQLAELGLQRAAESFNVFTQTIESTGSEESDQEVLSLAKRGFDLFIGVGPRATELLCSLASSYRKTQFSLVEADCEPSSNISLIEFSPQSMAEALFQFIQLASTTESRRVAWLEEQASPRLSLLKELLLNKLKATGSKFTMDEHLLNQERLPSSISKIESQNYAAVIVLASEPLQAKWQNSWKLKDTPLLLTGPSTKKMGIRLQKQVDHAVYQEVAKAVGDGFFPSQVVYSYGDGGLQLLIGSNFRHSSAYQKAFDLVQRPKIKPAVVN